MSKRFLIPTAVFAATLAIVTPARSQTAPVAPAFVTTYTLADGNTRPLFEGSTITFPLIDINTTATVVIDIVNQGTGPGSLTGLSVTGTGFRITGQPAIPTTIAAGQAARFQIVFSPAQAGVFNGSFRISLSGTSIGGTLSGSTASPTFSLAYVEPDTNNVLTLQDRGTLAFPNTLVNTTSSYRASG